VQVTDAQGNVVVSGTLTIKVDAALAITPPALSVGGVNVNYTSAAFTASGGIRYRLYFRGCLRLIAESPDHWCEHWNHQRHTSGRRNFYIRCKGDRFPALYRHHRQSHHHD